MKLRSMLTVLGIGIGIGAILFLVSLGQGLQQLLIERITTAEALLTLDVIPPGGQVALDVEAVEAIDAIPQVTETSPIKSAKAKIGFEGVSAGVTTHFVRENFFRLSGFDKLFLLGKESEVQSIFADERSIIVSQAVLDLLGMSKDTLEKNVAVELQVKGEDEAFVLEKSFTVADVLATEESAVYVLLDAYPEDKLTDFTSLKVQVAATTVLEIVREAMVEMGFIVSALSDTVRQANQIFTIMKVILAIFGIIALTVAAIGMFNTMTIALLERTQEIGIMRAIGASRKDIWLMFLTESFLVGFLGGVSGVLFGIGVGEAANAGLNLLARRLGGEPLDVFTYPLLFVIGIVVFSTLVAVITGFYPAQRAAHLNPLDALRYK